jgi:hypothetical protein
MGSAFMDDMLLDCCIMSDKLLSELETETSETEVFGNVNFEQLENRNPGLRDELLSILDS